MVQKLSMWTGTAVFKIQRFRNEQFVSVTVEQTKLNRALCLYPYP